MVCMNAIYHTLWWVWGFCRLGTAAWRPPDAWAGKVHFQRVSAPIHPSLSSDSLVTWTPAAILCPAAVMDGCWIYDWWGDCEWLVILIVWWIGCLIVNMIWSQNHTPGWLTRLRRMQWQTASYPAAPAPMRLLSTRIQVVRSVFSAVSRLWCWGPVITNELEISGVYIRLSLFWSVEVAKGIARCTSYWPQPSCIWQPAIHLPSICVRWIVSEWIYVVRC